MKHSFSLCVLRQASFNFNRLESIVSKKNNSEKNAFFTCQLNFSCSKTFRQTKKPSFLSTHPPQKKTNNFSEVTSPNPGLFV